MSFWIRRTKATDLTIPPLNNLVVPGNGGEVDLHASFDDGAVQRCPFLASAFLIGDLVKLDGEGGSAVAAVQEFSSILSLFMLDGTRSGVLRRDLFSGTPKIYTVQFPTAVSSSDYVVSLSPSYTGANTCSWSVTNKTASGFTINSGSDDLSTLSELGWVISAP